LKEKQKGKSSPSQGINKEVLKIYTQFNDFYDVILYPAESEIPHLYQVGQDSYNIHQNYHKDLIALAFARFPELVSDSQIEDLMK
jgi:hypothetical protein